MKSLFFYGTLRDTALLEIVLGRTAVELKLSDAILPDYAVFRVAEGPFPMIKTQEGAQAVGVLVEGLDPDDIARLDFYEGSFEYDLRTVTLAGGQKAEVYISRPGQWTPDGAWSLGAWQAKWGALSRYAAQEVLSYYGKRDRDAVAAMFPRIRARAAAKVNAQASLHGEGTLQGKVDVAQQRIAYSHYFAIQEIELSHERFNGAMSQTIERAVFMGNDAAIVLPYDPVRDCVLLVEQIRMGPLARGDRSLWQFEPIAGGIDPGESPQEAARREAEEEAGITLGHLEKIAEIYASPGNSTDFFYVFIGIADLPERVVGTGGLATEHEDIRSHVMGFEPFMAMVDSFGATNAPLVILANWLARHRERLRSA
jgi:ADP-ribose pyrophosphatase